MAFSWDLGITDLLGAGMDMLGDRMQYSYNKRLMNEQSKLNREQEKWSALHLPTLRRTGYEDAGYNPLVAFSSNFGSANGVSPSGFSSHLGSGSLSSMMEANTGREQAENQKKYQEAVVENQQADIKNKEAQTKVLEQQAEETRLNNKENRQMQSTRDKMAFLFDLLKQKLDYIRSSAGHTSTEINVPGFKRSEERDNYISYQTLNAIDALINKYGDGLFDGRDADMPFETVLGTVTNFDRTMKVLSHDLPIYSKDVGKFLKPVNKFLNDGLDKAFFYYNHEKARTRQYHDLHPEVRKELKKERSKKRYGVPQKSYDLYRDYNSIPGFELLRY